MRAKHWTLLALLLTSLATLDSAATWAEVFQPKGIAKMAAAGLLLREAGKTPWHHRHDDDEDGDGPPRPPRGAAPWPEDR